MHRFEREKVEEFVRNLKNKKNKLNLIYGYFSTFYLC